MAAMMMMTQAQWTRTYDRDGDAARVGPVYIYIYALGQIKGVAGPPKTLAACYVRPVLRPPCGVVETDGRSALGEHRGVRSLFPNGERHTGTPLSRACQ